MDLHERYGYLSFDKIKSLPEAEKVGKGSYNANILQRKKHRSSHYHQNCHQKYPKY